MKPNTREVAESPIWQGKDEKWAYKLDTTEWGGSPSAPECTIYNNASGEDLTGTNLEVGDPTTQGDNIISQRVIGLVPGLEYRLEFQWTVDGNIAEAYIIIHGQQ